MTKHLISKGQFWHRMPLSPLECEKALSCMLNELGLDFAYLELLICDDKESLALNSSYLNTYSPTNILSFPEDSNSFFEDEEDFTDIEEIESESIQHFLGSLALSIDTFEREVSLYHQEPKVYCLMLIVHGLAHLVNLDHGQEMDIFCQKALNSLKYIFS